MVEHGLDTFVEENSYWRSLCHAWSAHPALEFVERVLGITPGEPGYARIDVAPLRCGLTSASGGVCTPRGPVKVAWRVEGGIFHLEATTPARSTVHVLMPDRKRHVLPGGKIALSCSLS
jgi:hypothetical protein